MDRWRKLHGRRLDHEERTRKKAAREGHKASEDAQKLTGLRAKLYQKKRHHEKIQMKKQIKAHEERNVKSSAPNEPSSTPLPQYLLDRSNPTSAKALSSAIKNKRSEKAARFSVPLPKVKGISEQEMFKVVKVCRRNFFTSDTGSSSGTRSINLMEDHATVGGSSGVDILARQYLAILRLHDHQAYLCRTRYIYLILTTFDRLLTVFQTLPDVLSSTSDSSDLWVSDTKSAMSHIQNWALLFNCLLSL